MVTSEEKFNEENEKEVPNIEQKSNKNNDTLIVVQIVEELEANDKENVILEGFSLKVDYFEIDYLNMILSEIDGNIFFEFTTDREVHLLVTIFAFLSRFYPFDHNIFVQNVGGWFGHTPFFSFFFCFINFLFFKLKMSFLYGWVEWWKKTKS